MCKGRVMLLMARCQMEVAGFKPNRQGQTGNTALTEYWSYLMVSCVNEASFDTVSNCLPTDLNLAALAVDTLTEAAAYFSKLNCKERLREIYYLQAQLYHSLGQTSQRNKSAMLFRLSTQELQTPAPPVSMQL